MSRLASNGTSDQATRLYSLATAGQCRRVAIVGMAKNCGKTTTLNALAAAAAVAPADLQRSMGVTSAGRDGELFDAITGFAKPPVQLPAGALVAMAELTLQSATCDLEVLVRTGLFTGAGEIVIARARRSGVVEVFGCTRATDLAAALSALEAAGAGLCFVDGAAGRTFLASPDVADSIIVATGASLDPDAGAEGVAAATAAAVNVLCLGSPAEPLLSLAMRLQAAGESALVMADGAHCKLMSASILGREGAAVAAADEAEAIALVCGRAVGTGLLEALARWLHRRRRGSSGRRRDGTPSGGFEVVAADPSRVAASARSLASFEAVGGVLSVARRARVAAVTCNPTSPGEQALDPADLVLRVSKALGSIPVFDLVAQVSACRGVVDET